MSNPVRYTLAGAIIALMIVIAVAAAIGLWNPPGMIFLIALCIGGIYKLFGSRTPTD
ncbi:hypothetical protein Aph01nite_72230 [Acrocarpospora phusangensis]|uniref:Uncharacterized protein n=1 Tax=Acrocarpospora phusangensis TaxID=1070424 RepID=A0A919QHJ7_9ACTN|nr:hypothetical protein [Acrocarpospora phusangensis]GIH28913.1 hypothetical protein Aph01nite_72230 [Acrocarpospora phusangensis]